VALDSSSASGSFNWGYNSSALPWPDRDHELRVEAKVADQAGNYTFTSSTFSYDATPPGSRILYPPVNDLLYSSMTAISGTSLDLTSAVNEVRIRLWYLSGPSTYYWQPTAPHWSASDTGWQSIGGAPGPKATLNPWSYTNSDFSNPGTVNFAWKEGTHDGENGKTFQIITRAVDATTNEETTVSTRTFVFDNVPPVSAPVQPGIDTAYRNLPVIHGTSVDAVTTVASVKISILGQDEGGGQKYFDGSNFINVTETWLPIQPANLYPSSWSYTNGLLTLLDKRHYIVKSSATDSIGNVQNIVGQSRFLFDTTEPQSVVVSPVNATVYNDNKVVLGNSSDPGFTNGINGTGSGVYPSLPWHSGKVDALVFRDTEPFLASNGPIIYGAWDDSGYFWNGSTWAAAAAGPVWQAGQFTDSLGNWQYSGLVCPDPNPTNIPCWVRGDPYVSWVRVTDNAANTETIIDQGPKFYIAAPAQSFLVTVSADPMTAGSDINMSVTAKDGPNGTGNTAAAYQGLANFYLDGVPGGPEVMDTDGVMDNYHGLPQQYLFLPGDFGTRTFQMRARKAGGRVLRAEDNDNPAIFGTRNITVNPTTPDRVQVIADFDPSGQQPAPGRMDFGVEGSTGAPRTKPAGSNVPFLLQVTDMYWNLVVSSAASVYVSDTDTNNDSISADGLVVFTGSTTISRTFVSANSAGWGVTASGQGLYTNPRNPSSNVPVIAQAADRLLALLPGETRVQGKAYVQPYGKTGTPDDRLAGSTLPVTVYGVDPYYNTDITAAFQVSAAITSDPYDITPAPQNLVSGATVFVFVPVVAATQTIKTESSSLSPATSVYFTPNPVKVWWNRPAKLHLIPAGQALDAGRPPYSSNPSGGGKSGSSYALQAGVTTQMAVYLVDDYYNVVRGTTPFMVDVASNTPVIQVDFLNDPNIQGRGMHPTPYQKSLVAGATNFSVIPVTRNQTTGLSVRVTDTGLTSTFYSTDTVNGVIVNPAPAVNMLLLVPNEVAAEGVPGGKTGTAGPLVAGSTYTVSVRAVDTYGNLTTDGRMVRIISNDIYAVHPPAQPMAGGIAMINGFVPSAATNNMVIDALDDDSVTPKLSTGTDSGVVVAPGTASRLIVLLPTQYLVPGKTVPPYGVAGSISTQTAGVYFTASVYAADTRYNRVYGIAKSNIRATSDDAFAPNLGFFEMTDGSATITNISLRSAGFRTVTATDLSGSLPNLGATPSGTFLLNPNNPTKLRTMVPVETRVGGSTGNGRTGVVDGQQAGFPFTVTVDIADAFWNLTPGASQEIRLVCNDPFSIVSPSTQVVLGSATFTVTPKRAGPTYVRAEMVAAVPAWGPTLNVDTATLVNVAAGIPRRMLLLMPGETFDQGSPTGKVGSLGEQKAGTDFGVTVGVVDDFFNLVPGRPADVRVNTPSDPYAPAVSTAAINTGSGYTDLMYVNLHKAATHYLTATDYGSSGLSDDPQSSTFTVRPADPVGLQLLVPGQTAVPGSGAYPAGGKVSVISTQTAGTPFYVTVNLVDPYMNRYTDLTVGPTVYLVTSDIYDAETSSSALNYGTLQMQMNLVTRTSASTIKVFPVSAADNNVCSGNFGDVCLGSDAAAKASLKVFSSTATRLEVVLPGQGLAEGKCNISPPCRDPMISWPGRTGPPAAHTIGTGAMFASVYVTDQFYNRATELVAAAQDTNPVAVMPSVEISMPGDFKTLKPSPQTLSNGSAVFSIDARTALSSYTVVGATIAASAASYATGISTIAVNPGPPTHMLYVLPSTTVVAGFPFSATLIVRDIYENNCSTGPNVYLGTAAFAMVDQINPNQDSSLSAPTVPFYRSDLAVKDLPGWFTFRKAGVNTMGAYDTLNPMVNVTPLVNVAVLPGPPNIYRVEPNADVEVGAGSNDLRGQKVMTAQLSDAFDNNISSSGVPAYLDIAEVVGDTGTLQYQSGASWLYMGVSTIVYTDLNGQVGISTPMAYRVSSKAGDWARVWIGTTTVAGPAAYATYVAARQNVSGKMTTIGGVPSKLLFISSQPAATVGIQEVAGAGAPFTLERRDYFNNLTTEGQTDVFLSLPSAQVSIHTALGRTMGTFGTFGDYGFRGPMNDQFIPVASILPNQTNVSFRYHDRTSSYSGLSPALNTREGNRPGYWQIEARSGALQHAEHQLRVDPIDIAKVSFGNAQRTLVAGKITDNFGVQQHFKAELRDMFDNPSLATAAVRVAISTFTRQPSLVNDSFSFSASTVAAAAFPPVFASTVTYLDIPIDSYSATFYYLDTTASSVYGSTLTLRPLIKLQADDQPAWASSTQPVHVLSDFTYRVNVSLNAGQSVMAGTTSQMFAMSIEDKFGNPTPVASGQEDAIGAGVSFNMDSDSAGDVRFSAPDVSSFTVNPGSAKMALGESATSFYLIDTLTSHPTHQLTINTVMAKGWLPAVSSYTVVPAQPDHVYFHTTPRRLVAGTTLQYADFALNLTTPTVVSVVLKDRYENTTTTSSVATVRFSAVRNTTYGGIDPTESVLSSNPSWKLLKTNPLDLSIFPGQSFANIYIWDTIVGTATLTADASIAADFVTFPRITQEAYITPSTAAYFTLHHAYNLGNPLRVQTPGNVTLRVRDKFGNITTGDTVNGNYYTGKIKMATNSRGSADLRDWLANTTDYTFVPADHGERELLLQDTFVETLKVNVTDYHSTSIYGYTGDSARGMPVVSNADVVLSGLVITPTDMSPEDPLPVAKASIGINKYAMYQGDGVIADVPAPVPMLRLTMQTSPIGAPPAYMKSVQVKSSGTLAWSDMVEVAMYADNPTYGQIGAFDGETELGGAPVDIFMSSGTYDTGLMAWSFDDLAAKVSTAALVSNTPRNFFFAVRVSTLASTPRSFALVLDNPSFVVLNSTFVGVAYNNFPIATATSPVRNQPATIQIQGEDIAAWWQPTVGTTTLTLGRYPYVEQGQGRVGFLEIKAWTENFIGTIKSFKIIKTGTGSGADLRSVRLFLDSSGGDPDLGDGIFAASIDKEITDPLNPPLYDVLDPDTFVLPLINPGIDGAISVSTRSYFVVYEFGSDAISSMTHGARLENSGVNLVDGVVGAFQPIVSSTVPLYSTADIVYLVDVNKSQPNDFSKPSFVTQDDRDKAVVRLTMQINGSQGSAIWSGLKLDRWVTAAENGNTPVWNKVTDVKKISIWQDSSGNGLLETTGLDKDTEVLMIGPNLRTFPYDALKAPIMSTDTVIRVYDVQRFFATDSPFPPAPGRLIVNDGQANPDLKEVIYYSTVDVLGNAFSGLTRGAEGTVVPSSWPAGTILSGQAVLPMIGSGGALDGQAIYNVAKDYFVTYDIDPLANVSNFAYIGMAIRSTDYFMIAAPKLMSTANVGVTAPGKSLSLIGKVREYSDEVIVKATDTILGPTLQQQGVDQPVMAFTLETNVADAMWRWLTVYATGTVIQDGTAINDISVVKVWYDKDNNGFLGGSDVMVGSGTFGNTIYGPLTARVDFGTEQRIITALEAANSAISHRYFLTYDIRDSAMPNDALGNPRYLGAYLKAESLPQGSPIVDDPRKNALSLPNFFSAVNSNLTFVSRVREIISSPSTVTVLTEPIFSPDYSASKLSVRLADHVNTIVAQDSNWVVTSTVGLPSSGYAVVDNEIVHYAGTTAGALSLVTRGAFNSPIITHSSGTVLGGMIYQGMINYPFMQMTLTTSGYGVRWVGLKLSRKQPASLVGYDDDVAVVRVWKDNGNGVFDRDAATGLNTSDVIVGSGRFGANDPVGKATIYVKDPALNDQNYVVVKSTPILIFVSMDIDKASRFSNVLLSPQNDVLGVEIPFETNFLFGPENSGHTAQFLSPALSQLNALLPTLNNITLTPEDISPVSVTQNDKNVGVLAMRLVTDKTSARVEAIKLDRRGSANDSDIDLIKVWKDSNDNCILDSVDTSSSGAGVYPNLASYGNESFSSSTVNIALKNPIVVTTNPVCAFISYDMSQFAIIGSTAGLSINSTAYVTIGIPNTVTLTTWPVNTMPMVVWEIPSNVALGANDVANELVLAGGVNQAQLKAPMLRFNLATEAGNARWSAIKVQRTGASNDPNAPFGKNTDVKLITIYQDSNQNDMLDVNDVNISEARSIILNAFTSTDTLPFNLVLASTAGFPVSGRLYIEEAELVSYDGSGIDAGTGKPYLRVFARGEKLGDFYTPVVNHPSRSPVRKVDLFDQENPLNTQTYINLSQVQTLSPLPQTYFSVYDIGEMAIKANKVGMMIRDKSWIVVNAPHDVSPSVYVGITKALPKGTYSEIYPFNSSLVPIKAVNLTVTGISIAPKSAEKNTKSVPVMTFNMATLTDYVALGQINLQQTGSISSATFNFGDGDLAGVALWKDDGDGAFSPISDARLGYTVHSATNTFELGVSVSIQDGNLPYLIISTSTVILHLSCDISSGTDLSDSDTMGHLAGLTLGSFTDLRGMGGMQLAAGQYYADTYPMESNQILISPAIIPLTPVYRPIMLASNGYPAYTQVDSSGNVKLGFGNIPETDTTFWDYTHPPAGCRAGEPLIDINGDMIPDNFDYYGSGKCNNISLNNSGLPSFDIDGDHLLDFESNLDYVPDRIINDGTGKPLYFIGDNVQNVKMLLAVSDLGAVPSVWAAKTTELTAMWNPASTTSAVAYELSLGGSFSDPTGIKNAWQPAGTSLAGKLTNVALSPGHFTRLASRIDVNTSSFSVISAAGFAAEGVVYVGNEIMVVTKIDDGTFKINQRGVQGSFRGPHTAWGETVSDRGYVLSVRGQMADGRYIPSESGVPIMIYRIDTTYPTNPGAPEPQVAKGVASGQAYTLKWDSAEDPESNVMSYEIQEREGTNPVWKTVAAIPGFKTGGAINNIYTIGDPVNPGETPRPLGKYYTYRVRSWNFAGIHSEWSPVSTPAGTTVGEELLSKVSNYPNPVDLRKGGVEGRTVINYTLNDNAEVTITIYDLLGYIVREFTFTSGTDGGKLGPNFVIWNGRNGLGGYVSKGGYIVRVKASSPKGSKVIMRKVGVIH